MELYILLIIAGLIVTALLIIAYPLLAANDERVLTPTVPAGHTLAETQARYQAKLAAIKDLMFDYEMGKVSAEDHHRLVSQAKLEAAHLRRQMDRLATAPAPGMDADLDTEIEREIEQALNRATTLEINPEIDQEIERLVAQVQVDDLNGQATLLAGIEAELALLKQNPAPAFTCPHCQTGRQPDDAFCRGCGRPLVPVVSRE